MTPEGWSAIAAALSAFTAAVSVLVAVRSERANARRVVSEREQVYQEKLYAIFPRLVDIVGVDDELDPEVRKVLVPFFMLYSHVWTTYSEGLAQDPSWRGLKGDFEWWAARPLGREAWGVMRRYEDTWPAGFCSYVDSMLSESESEPESEPEPESKPDPAASGRPGRGGGPVAVRLDTPGGPSAAATGPDGAPAPGPGEPVSPERS
jgi:hypothetical protein